MKKIAVTLLCAAFALPAFSADEKAMFAKHWQTAREFTIAVAEAMPADSYSFAPNPEEMSFGRLMVHIGMAQNSAFATVSGIKPNTPEKILATYKDPKGTFDKDTAIQFLKDSFDFCASTLDKISADQLESMTGPAGRQLTGRERLWSYFTHTAHHRGQAEVYLRVKGIKPPAYRF